MKRERGDILYVSKHEEQQVKQKTFFFLALCEPT